MGLEERKTIEAFQQERLPQLEQSILDAAGYKVELEVDWDAIAAQGIKDEILDIWQSIYFEPLIEALKAVKTDDQVAEALASKLKKVAIRCTGENTLSTGSYKPEFSDGLLSIDDRLCNYGEVKMRATRIQKLLEVIAEVSPQKTPKERVAEEMGKLKSGSIANVFSALQAVKIKSQSHPAIAMPWLTLSLTSGNNIEGYLLDYPLGTRNDMDCVLMISQREGKLMYVRIANIEAVTVNVGSAYSADLDEKSLVEAKGEVVKALAFDQLKINPAKIPGKMQVKRQVIALEQVLSDKIGKEVLIEIPWSILPDTEATIIAVSLILNGIQNVIDQKLANDAAFEAIKEKIGKIGIKLGDLKQVTLKDGLLSICVQMVNGEIDCLNEEKLSKMINNVL